MIRQAQVDLADAEYDQAQLQQLIKIEDAPPGYRGMSLSPDGAGLTEEAFSSQEVLNHVLEEELIHLGQALDSMTFGPGTMGEVEGAVNINNPARVV